MGEPIEVNLAGLEMMSRMVGAIQEMRRKIRSTQNEKDLCWNDWDYSYTVDQLLAEAGWGDDEDEEDE